MFIFKWLFKARRVPLGWLQKPKPRSRLTKTDREALYYDESENDEDRVPWPQEWRWIGFGEILKQAIKDYRREKQEFLLLKREDKAGLLRAKEAKALKVKRRERTRKNERRLKRKETIARLRQKLKKHIDRF